MNDLLYSSANEFGIPDLILPACPAPGGVPLPLMGWGTRSRQYVMDGGTIHHYVDDYRFSAHWQQRGGGILQSGCEAVCESNYSIFPNTPVAVALGGIYRKRWLARRWQDAGIQIFVDLCVPEHMAKLNLLGVPPGWRWYSTRAFAGRLDEVRAEYEIATAHAGPCTPVVFLVIGGGKGARELCQELPGAVHAG